MVQKYIYIYTIYTSPMDPMGNEKEGAGGSQRSQETKSNGPQALGDLRVVVGVDFVWCKITYTR